MKKIDDNTFFKEASLLSDLWLHLKNICPYIVDLHGIIFEPGVILTRYQKEGNLEQALVVDHERKRQDPSYKCEFPFMTRLKFVHNICIALSHLHKLNIVHRDVVMSNLLLADNKDRVLLSNFSLTRKVVSSLGGPERSRWRSLKTHHQRPGYQKTAENFPYRQTSGAWGKWHRRL